VKPHSRIRKTIKWGGSALTALLVAVWITSRTWGVSVVSNGGRFLWVDSGRVGIGYRIDFANSSWRGLHWIPTGGEPMYWWLESVRGPGFSVNRVPLWMPVCLCLYGTIQAWRSDWRAARIQRSARLNLCPKCNYDRAGIAAGAKCPECGSAAP
jgi:hypothetical protein